jgi:hypothetical protein
VHPPRSRNQARELELPWVEVPYPRPLTATEKDVLLRVLEMTDAPELDKLRTQVEVAVATEPCTCPCPSVGLAVDRERAQPISHEGPLDALRLTPP